MDRNLMIHIPAGFYSAYKDPRINWNYLTEPETGLRGSPGGDAAGQGCRRLFVDQLAWSTCGGIHSDYDRWADELGLGRSGRYADSPHA